MFLELLIEGFSEAILVPNLIACFGGVVFGILVGVLPGLNASTGIALLLPLTYGLTPSAALIMLCGIYVGGQFGGAITAITLNIPGTSPACATLIDGYPLSQKGRGGAAIGMATIASSLGGMIGLAVLVGLAKPLAGVALKFGPGEYFALGIFGLSIITSLSTDSLSKGIIACSAGFLISTIGIDQFIGYPRFIFGRFELMSGVPMLPVFIGFFAASEAFKQAEKEMIAMPLDKALKITSSLKDMFPTLEEMKRSVKVIIHSGLIGSFVGVLPGAGATIAAFMGYNETKRWSKKPELFGTGIMEGVAAPESANNAAVGGALVPMLTLGIPGSGSTAIMLGALMVHGLQPGPLLFEKNPLLIAGLYGGLFIANIFLLILGLFAARHFVKVLNLPESVLSVLVLCFCIVGAYSSENNIFGVVLMLVFGFCGYFMVKLKYPITPLVLGYVLGPIVEENLRRALIVYAGDLTQFFTRPISGVLLVLALVTLLSPFYQKKLQKFLNRPTPKA